jgi:hypothetical protein
MSLPLSDKSLNILARESRAVTRVKERPGFQWTPMGLQIMLLSYFDVERWKLSVERLLPFPWPLMACALPLRDGVVARII